MAVPLVQPAASAASAALEQARGAATSGATERPGAAGKVSKAFASLIEAGQAADTSVARLATGESADVHNTMAQLGQADLELRFTVQIRNRALAAYEEIMRLQV